MSDAVCLWLHGDGETGMSWKRLEKDPMSGLGLRLPWVRWSFPTAPEGRGFAYEFPVLEARVEQAGLDAAVSSVHAMIREIEATGIPPSRILLGGFGPGAALALLAGRLYPHSLAGIAAISGWYLRPREPSSETRAPVLLCHGVEDDDVDISMHDQAISWLKRDGFEVSHFRYDGLGHRACAEELTVLAAPKNFITAQLPTLTPAPAAPRGRIPPMPSGEVPRCKLDQPRDEPATSAAPSARLESMDEEDGALVVVLALEGVSSLAEAELSMSDTQLELQLPSHTGDGRDRRPPLIVRFPRTVDSAASDAAKFNRKTGMLRLRLALAPS